LAYNYNTFTLDKNVYDLIYHEFISLYKKKLIYRDFKLVNWDVKLKTAISDIEVIHKKTNSHLYYFKYYLSGNKKIFLEVATTRPETMFVDTNLVINHKDKRYLKYVGMKFINPINDQDLILISDHTIDASFGTGVMKCTPAHDFFDYELAKRHKITNYHSVIELDGKLNNYANTKYGNYEALDRLIARKKIVEEMKKRQLISKIVAYESNIGYSERSNEVVEPLLSMQ
jgi:valyl-tRNA synthetase